ncbi:GGDEF domain-containing protein [Clostridium tagluense]|uniref:GGDEF domain-containing protein n=1 Tax=Clostridium tagluense TaxID=360422 RepID=A0A401UKD8_9CLOT|nr:GGDEF domain-containing protein [Clostridium tagluense]MBU3129816.1 GGDEF domain-containing protein [Clostridium tagluense]MCB2314194.1 GGDEF domain-containing protein [Clostridium tagluense]MCB2319057.1 GGDEF domain-containing protein [Clostridium tagluense]MCB2323925.1 GGDEF domain-containing protein [Clostridium tagluense]MCB2328790.1 GGDEF domain-containing protein [Clostridium tagluense]
MEYKDISKERLIEIIEAKDKIIQELQSLKTELQYQAYMDSVTGVLNRRAGLEILDATIYDAARQGENFIICFFDIDNFKKINDTFGHSEGDKILTETSNILRANIRKTDTVFRIGGDEFVIIFPNTTLEVAKTICSRICMKIDELKQEDKSNHMLGLSYGFSEYNSKNKISAGELIREADEGMYVSKRLKK